MSRQLDVVIADNSGTPILFQAEDGSEYFPYEGVYAIGEVKTSYRRSERYIYTFAEHLAEIHAQLDRKEPEPRFVMRNFHEVIPDSIYGNPLFSFMFFVDAGDFSAEDVIDLYQMHPPDTLPNIVCFLQKGVIVNMVTHFAEDNRHNWGPLQPMLQPGTINLNPARNMQSEDVRHQWVLKDYGTNVQHMAAHFGTLYYMLATHLRECRLTAPDLVAYIDQLFDTPALTIIG